MEFDSNPLLVLLLFVGCTGKAVQFQKVNTHLSPLDDLKPNPALEPNFGLHGSEFATELPSCQTVCLSSVMKVFSVYFRSGSFKENMRWACDSYDEAIACMRHNTHCGADPMFESLTSGLQYMCRKQKDAFIALSDCIDSNSGRVRNDCDLQCQPETLATGIAVKDTVMNQLEHPLVSKNVNMRRIIEPHMSRFFFSQGCKIGQCLMGCTRTKYNMLCEGTAGSLLLEMLVRPFSVNSDNVAAFPSTSHLASFLGSFLPHQCSFLTARDGAPDSYRIDPELDKEIKRMYADKDRRKTMPLHSSLSLPTEIEDPFLQMSNTFNQVSPFDDPEIANDFLEDDVFPGSGLFDEPSRSVNVSQTGRSIEGSGTDPHHQLASANHNIEIFVNDSEKIFPQMVVAGKTVEVHVRANDFDAKGELVCFVREEKS